jgi:hypothetical protein
MLGVLSGMPFPAFLEAFWTVQGKDGGRVPFRLNMPQRICEWEVEKLRAGGKAVLLKILKARQEGISTWACARVQHGVETVPGFSAISLADKKELPRQWLRRAERWHGETPQAEKLAASNAIELYLAEAASRYWIGSAQGQTPGMGFTPWAAHGSELENWARPEKVMADLLPAVPLSNPRAMVIWESTGEMAESWWHREVVRSIEGKDGFRFIFLPWWLMAEYSILTERGPRDYTDEEREVCEDALRWAKDNPEHAMLVGFKALTPEQIEWRRFQIETIFSGDRELFASRYPGTVAEAFMGVGSLAIPAEVVRWHKSTVVDPVMRFKLVEKAGKVEMEADETGSWELLEPLDKETDYAVGGDVAEGKVSDSLDERSERDFSAAVVLNRKTLATTAVYHGRPEPDVFGREMVMGAKFFNMAWMAPEANSAGMATLSAMRSYPRIMSREGWPDSRTPPAARPLEKLGWKTTAQNRDLLIDTYIAGCRKDPQTQWHNSIKCLSSLLAGEEGTFIRTKNGKRQHRATCHDDVLFGTMIALRVHQNCPRETPGQRIRVNEEVMDGIRDRIGAVKPVSGDYDGGFDEWDPSEEVETVSETV